MWDKTAPYNISSAPFSITALDTNELTLARRYNIEFASMLPEGGEIEYNVTVANITSTACDLMDNGEMLAHFVKSAPRSSAILTLTEQPTVNGTSVSAGRFVSFDFLAAFDATKLDSLNGILNN